MRIGVIGINHKLADLELREQLAKACEKRFKPGLFYHGPHHFVLLSTCNRTELYFSSDDLSLTHTYILNILRNEVFQDFDQKLYTYFGLDCFLHLSRVTAGLDSAIVAETEIQGQVKNCYEIAKDHTILGKDIHYLFQKSLRIGKKIRTDFLFHRNLPEIEQAVFQTGFHFFKNKKTPKILFVGVSEINKKILYYLYRKEAGTFTICNRTHEKSVALSKDYPKMDVLPWNQLHEWIHYDWIVLGTKAKNYLIAKEEIQGQEIEAKLVMDLCVPRNVDPALCLEREVTLLNIDQLDKLLRIRKKKLSSLIIQAEDAMMAACKMQVLLFKKKENSKIQSLFAVGA